MIESNERENSLNERRDDLQFNAGDKVNNFNGKNVDDSAFSFVQQDKKIHDTKFVTRPTTFFKDAMKRFRKNKSSVIGGIILGVLFVLAIILPIDFTVGDTHISVLPYDIDNVHNYETNMPMKLFPAGTGFWDGTRTFKNQSLPYASSIDENGNIVLDYENYIGSYDDPSVILDIKDIERGYLNNASSNGSGGYARIDAIASGENENQTAQMYYAQPLTFNLEENNYYITYTLGTREAEGYVDPEYALLMKTRDGDIDILTEYTSDYGPEIEKTDEDMTVTQHESVTVCINELLAERADDVTIDPSVTQVSLGFIMRADKDNATALYLKSFVITGQGKDGSNLTRSETNNLRYRSFGTDDGNSTIQDANSLVQINDTSSNSYWRSISYSRFDSVDTVDLTCSLVIDYYLLTYGYRSNMEISMSQFDKWRDAGYIEYDYNPDGQGNGAAVATFKITEAGERSGEVYVKSVERQTQEEDKDGNTIYTMHCTVLMWKYLGYNSMPIHVLGTEATGRDMLKYVFAGLQTSLLLGVLVSFVNILIGLIWGSISGYFGGITDLTMERITDILSGIPWIVLMTVLTLKIGSNFFVFGLSLCLTGWIGTASSTRSQFYRYRGREYVLASKTLGAKTPRLIFRHILPNAIGPIITSSVLMIPSVIFNEATISYLGLGLQDQASLGVILSNTQKTLNDYPYQLVIPAIIISLLMICFNLFGNGLRDAFNPSLKGSE